MSYKYRYYHSDSPTPTVRHKPRIRFRSLFALSTVVLVASVIIASHLETKSALPADAVAHTASHLKSPASLRASTTIRTIIAGDTSDTVGVAIEDISTGNVSTYGATTPFEAASTEKVLSAVVYYHLVERGALSLNDQVGVYPASYQIQEMINESDDESWDAINDAVGGNGELQSYAKSIGLQYNVDGNTMRAQDEATLLTKLYSGKLLNSTHTRQLLSYMQQTNDETMIPSVVPGNLTVYHKYGELDDIDSAGDDVQHDAAIVTDGSSSYAIVIYTSGQSSEADRTDTIKQIARQTLIVCGW